MKVTSPAMSNRELASMKTLVTDKRIGAVLSHGAGKVTVCLFDADSIYLEGDYARIFWDTWNKYNTATNKRRRIDATDTAPEMPMPY